MKKYLFLAALVGSPMASANVLGFGGGVEFNYMHPTYEFNAGDVYGDEGGVTGVTLNFEHPVPLVPNVRFDGMTAKGGDVFKYNQHNVTGYYRIIDLDRLVSVNTGLGLTNISGTKLFGESGELDTNAAHAYLEGAVFLPFTGVSAHAVLVQAKGSDYEGTNAKIGLRYTFDVVGVEPSINVGYQYVSQDFSDVKGVEIETQASGVFGSLRLNF
ncbi:hypothetical protein AB4254_12205 [Vibrio breoganii]